MSGVESELAIGWGVDIGESELGPRHTIGRIEHAEAEARFEKALDGAIDVFGGDETILEGMVEDFELRTATEVSASFERERGGLIEREDEVVALIEVVDSPAVGDNVTSEAPLIAEKIEEQTIGAGGLATDGIVGAHDGIGAAIDNGGPEGGRVGVVEIVERDGNIETMAEELGAAMDGVVFGSGYGLQVVGVVAL